MTDQQMVTKANKLQARIEADLHAAGLDPAMGDYDHPLNAEWLALNEAINAAS